MLARSLLALAGVVLSVASSILAATTSTGLASHNETLLLVKRAKAFSKLTPGVQAYLETLDPSEYELDLEDDEEFENDIEKRSPGKYYTQCKGGATAQTYDDGPYHWHSLITNKYNAAGHKITFFQNGWNYVCAYNSEVRAVRAAIAAGNQLCHHTWNHASLPSLTDKQIDEQVDLLETLFIKVYGVVSKCIRPPYGDQNQRVLNRLANHHGYHVIGWDIDSGDSDGASPDQQKQVYNTQVNKGGNHIILSHETYEPSAHEVADHIVDMFGKKGIKSVTINECLGKTGSMYKVKTKPKKRDSSWTCAGTPEPGKN